MSSKSGSVTAPSLGQGNRGAANLARRYEACEALTAANLGNGRRGRYATLVHVAEIDEASDAIRSLCERVEAHNLTTDAGKNKRAASCGKCAGLAALLERARVSGGSCFVKGSEIHRARCLVRLGLGTLRDDGAFGPQKGRSNVDGERWYFEVL